MVMSWEARSKGGMSTAAAPHLLMSCSTAGGGSVLAGKRGKSGLRLKVPSGPATKGWQREKICLRAQSRGQACTPSTVASGTPGTPSAVRAAGRSAQHAQHALTRPPRQS